MGRLRKLNGKMTSCRRGVLVLLAFAAILSFTTCENMLSAFIQQDEQYQKNILGFDVTPETGRWVAGNETIRIVFAEGVDTDSLILGGTMGISESNIMPIDWSDTNGKGLDTLNLDPVVIGGLWSEGNKTLILSVTSITGKTVKALSIDFDVQYAICVDGESSGDQDGSVRFPFALIQHGIDEVSSIYTPGPGTTIPVRIAVGTETYSNDCIKDIAWVANLKNRVSLHGGYRDDFTGLSISGATILENTGNTNTGDFYDPTTVIYCGAVIEGTPVLENLTVHPGGSASSTGVHAGIHIEGSNPILRNITVAGEVSGGPPYVIGVVVKGGSPSIENPDIDPGNASNVSVGLYVRFASPTVSGIDTGTHRISSGTGEIHAFAFVQDGSGYGASITGITIAGPSNYTPSGVGDINFPDDARGSCIFLQSGSPSFTDNVFTLNASWNLQVVYENGINADPLVFTGNDFALTSSIGVWYFDEGLTEINESNYQDIDKEIDFNRTTAPLVGSTFGNFSSTRNIY